jgi:hypothetical protein
MKTVSNLLLRVATAGASAILYVGSALSESVKMPPEFAPAFGLGKSVVGRADCRVSELRYQPALQTIWALQNPFDASIANHLQETLLEKQLEPSISVATAGTTFHAVFGVLILAGQLTSNNSGKNCVSQAIDEAKIGRAFLFPISLHFPSKRFLMSFQAFLPKGGFSPEQLLEAYESYSQFFPNSARVQMSVFSSFKNKSISDEIGTKPLLCRSSDISGCLETARSISKAISSSLGVLEEIEDVKTSSQKGDLSFAAVFHSCQNCLPELGSLSGLHLKLKDMLDQINTLESSATVETLKQFSEVKKKLMSVQTLLQQDSFEDPETVVEISKEWNDVKTKVQSIVRREKLWSLCRSMDLVSSPEFLFLSSVSGTDDCKLMIAETDKISSVSLASTGDLKKLSLFLTGARTVVIDSYDTDVPSDFWLGLLNFEHLKEVYGLMMEDAFTKTILTSAGVQLK